MVVNFAQLGVEVDVLFEMQDLWDGISVASEPAKILRTLQRLSELYPAA